VVQRGRLFFLYFFSLFIFFHCEKYQRVPFSLEWVDPMVAISIKDLFLFDSRNDKEWAGQSLQIDSAMLSYKIVIEQRVVQSSRLVFLYFFTVKNISQCLFPLHGST